MTNQLRRANPESRGILGLLSCVRLMRPQQWIKNGFVLAPLIFSGSLNDTSRIASAAGAVVLFSLMSSAIYIFNDIADVENDRQHRKKRTRPLASGAVSMQTAWMLLALLVASILTSVHLMPSVPATLLMVLGLYGVLNVAYSAGLKHVSLVELLIVASGFVLRVVAGGVAIGVAISNWMLVCTALISLILVIGKRRADLAQDNDPDNRRRVLTEYDLHFLDSLLVMLSGAVLVSYLLFCISEYGQRQFGQWLLATGVFVILGVFRFLQIVMVKQGGDSPTTLVVRDPVMALTVLAWLSAFVFLIY